MYGDYTYTLHWCWVYIYIYICILHWGRWITEVGIILNYMSLCAIKLKVISGNFGKAGSEFDFWKHVTVHGSYHGLFFNDISLNLCKQRQKHTLCLKMPWLIQDFLTEKKIIIPLTFQAWEFISLFLGDFSPSAGPVRILQSCMLLTPRWIRHVYQSSLWE